MQVLWSVYVGRPGNLRTMPGHDMSVWTAAETVVEDAEDLQVIEATTPGYFATISFGPVGLRGRVILSREAAHALWDGLDDLLVGNGPDDGSDDLHTRLKGK